MESKFDVAETFYQVRIREGYVFVIVKCNVCKMLALWKQNF